MDSHFDLNKFLYETSLEKKIKDMLDLEKRILEEQGECITRKMTPEEAKKYGVDLNKIKK